MHRALYRVATPTSALFSIPPRDRRNAILSATLRLHPRDNDDDDDDEKVEEEEEFRHAARKTILTTIRTTKLDRHIGLINRRIETAATRREMTITRR